MVTAEDRTKSVNKHLIRAQQSDDSGILAAREPDNRTAERYLSCTRPDAWMTETEVCQIVSFVEYYQHRLLHYKKQQNQLREYSKQLLHEIPTAPYSTFIQ